MSILIFKVPCYRMELEGDPMCKPNRESTTQSIMQQTGSNKYALSTCINTCLCLYLCLCMCLYLCLCMCLSSP